MLAIYFVGSLIWKQKTIYKLFIFGFLAFVTPFVIIHLVADFKYSQPDLQYNDSTIVILGAGINNNETPTDILKKRLETGFEIYNQTKLKIIVTGDNSVIWHNEPRVMKNYLMKLGANPSDVTEDFGGRRTMDSCYRVKNYFNVSSIILISQGFHTPRAMFLCESVGLNVWILKAQDTGFGSTAWGYFREVPASWSAFIDSIYFQPQVGSNGREELK